MSGAQGHKKGQQKATVVTKISKQFGLKTIQILPVAATLSPQFQCHAEQHGSMFAAVLDKLH